MKTLILYTSKHGCTEKCAGLLAAELAGDPALVDLRGGTPDLSGYDGVILGAPIYAGNLPGNMKNYLTANADELKQKKLGLFICCGQVEQGAEQLKAAFPADLMDHACVSGSFGGAISLEKQNFIVRAMLKKVMKIQASYESIDSDAIAEFAQQWAK